MLYTQPQSGPLQIDWSNPITKGLTGLWIFNRNYTNCAGSNAAVAVASGTPGFAVGPTGIYANPGSNARVSTGLTASQLGINGARKRTIIVDYRHPDVATAMTLFSLGGTASAGNGFQIVKVDFTTVQVAGWFLDSSFFQITPGSADHRVFLAITFDGAGGIGYKAIAKNVNTGAVTRYSGQQSSLSYSTSDNNPLNFFNGAFDAKGALTSPLYSVFVFSDRVLSSSEIESLYANKYQVILDEDEEEESFLYAPADGGGVTADLSKTLGAVTSSAAGSVDVAGVLTKTLGAATLSSAGAVAVAGALSATLGAFSLTGAGAVAIAGAASVALGAASLSGAGAISITGALSKTLGGIALASTGTVGAPAINATLTATLGAATVSATGQVAVAGAMSQSLGAMSLASSGSIAITGSLGATLGAVTIVSTVRSFLLDTRAAPDARLCKVPAEARSFTIPADRRSTNVEPDSDTLPVARERRTIDS